MTQKQRVQMGMPKRPPKEFKATVWLVHVYKFRHYLRTIENTYYTQEDAEFMCDCMNESPGLGMHAKAVPYELAGPIPATCEKAREMRGEALKNGC